MDSIQTDQAQQCTDDAEAPPASDLRQRFADDFEQALRPILDDFAARDPEAVAGLLVGLGAGVAVQAGVTREAFADGARDVHALTSFLAEAVGH